MEKREPYEFTKSYIIICAERKPLGHADQWPLWTLSATKVNLQPVNDDEHDRIVIGKFIHDLIHEGILIITNHIIFDSFSSGNEASNFYMNLDDLPLKVNRTGNFSINFYRLVFV